jgi:hypothetical protein
MSPIAIALLAWIGFNGAVLVLAWLQWATRERLTRRAIEDMIAKAERYANASGLRV